MATALGRIADISEAEVSDDKHRHEGDEATRSIYPPEGDEATRLIYPPACRPHTKSQSSKGFPIHPSIPIPLCRENDHSSKWFLPNVSLYMYRYSQELHARWVACSDSWRFMLSRMPPSIFSEKAVR